jgi:hypothetical protein
MIIAGLMYGLKPVPFKLTHNQGAAGAVDAAVGALID